MPTSQAESKSSFFIQDNLSDVSSGWRSTQVRSLAQRVVWRCWCRGVPCSPSTYCSPDAATAWREQRTAMLNHFPLRCWPAAVPLVHAFAFRALLRT